ncbi:apolipoprotein N-acyltransferase [Microbacterium karelineae]|uniref:apolipoprotein N-acyltransferase n=1 Tax=Microbacterium karelineae TaxID=2654283 RepID=UPI0012E9BCD1|nr:apolipoprotein N-acyltransferase [Microbacterium karelineae]
MSSPQRSADAPARALLPLWAAVIAAAVGGFALVAAFPAPGIWPLSFAAVVLSLLSLIGRRAGGALLVGAVFAACFYLPHIDWAASFLGDHPLRWVPWVALAGVETIFSALGAIVIALAYRWVRALVVRPIARLVTTALLVAGVWTSRELVMGSWPYGGFPWGRIGMSLAESPFAPLASWVGPSGMTFLVVLVAALAIEAGRRFASARGEGPRAWRPVLAPAALLVALAVVPQFPTSAVGSLRVAAVQGDGPAAYLDDRERYDVLEAQLAASAPVVDDEVDLVLWPEGGVDADPLADANAAVALDRAARAYGAPILMNAAVADGDLVYNTSMLWTDAGADQSHAKRFPVPFGEYVPQRELYARIVPDLIAMIQREYEPGDDSPTVDVDGATVGLAICFDVLFDQLVAEGIADGAQVLMFQTNNADFRGTDENLQQLAFARMRAIETGRAVVNVSTVGTSQVIGPDGTTLEQIPADEPGAIIADVELRDGTTPAVAAGEAIRSLLLWLPLVAVAALGAAVDRMRRLRADQAARR